MSLLPKSSVLLACSAFLGASPALGQAPSQGVSEEAVSQASGAGAEEPSEAPGAKSVKMPELLYFEPAVYPVEAQELGLEAQVILRLTIDAAGTVTKAEVTEQQGHGFDEAAQKAALKFRFSPAERDGKPIAVQILYRYSFTLEEREVESEKAEDKSAGNLEGRVFIAGTEVPLAGARVSVTNPSGQVTEISTDASGAWRIEQQPPGLYQVRIQASGYEPLSAEETVQAGEALDIVYRLVPEGEGLVVTVVGERPPREVTRRTLVRREIARIPGTSGDAIRSIQNLPGVARPPGLAGLLIVRGSSPQDTLAFIDGAYVPLIYHFGGLSSVVPTELLEKIDFYPGNFSVRYGRAQGGIVDVALARPDTTCRDQRGQPTGAKTCYHGLVQGDLIDTRVLLQGPVASSDKWSFALAGRRSWVDVWLKPVLEEAGASVTTAPVYRDYQAILHGEIDQDTTFRLQAYGSSDELRLLISDPATEDPAFGGNLSLVTRFYYVQSLFRTQLSKDVRLESMLAAGQNHLGFSLGPLLFNIDLTPVISRNEFGFRLSDSLTWNVGMDFGVFPFEVTVRAPPPPRPGEPPPGPFAAQPPLETTQKTTGFRPAWYTDFEWQATRRLRFVPGVRVDYARDSGHADVSPRVNARYEIIGKSDEFGNPTRKTVLKGGAGFFHQPPEFQETDSVFGTPGIESNRAIHYSLGVERELLDQVDLSLEGFYKDFQNQVSRSPDTNGTFRYDNAGEGSAIGLEGLLKYRADERFFGWIAYTLSRSVVRDRPESEDRLFNFDQTHNLTMLGSYQLGRGWEFGARFRLVSGNLVTPVVPFGLPALYVADAGAYVPLQGEPFSRRLPMFHQLDLRVDKRWRFEAWMLSAYLDVQNAYNNQAAEGLIYSYNFSEQAYQTGLPLIPSIGLRGEF